MKELTFVALTLRVQSFRMIVWATNSFSLLSFHMLANRAKRLIFVASMKRLREKEKDRSYISSFFFFFIHRTAHCLSFFFVLVRSMNKKRRRTYAPPLFHSLSAHIKLKERERDLVGGQCERVKGGGLRLRRRKSFHCVARCKRKL
jgi:hypothetical protein